MRFPGRRVVVAATSTTLSSGNPTLRDRIHATLIALALLAASVAAVPSPARAAGLKVAIIVGPTGALTASYRSYADAEATTATAAGATVVKVYSPNATWANVKAAVSGASIVIYHGHGSGFPNPYSATEWTASVNGWGLNKTTSGGDGAAGMVYCGEKALLGTLTSSDVPQWSYCGGSTNTDGIAPASNFVMIYANACYTPGAGEARPAPDVSVARARVANFSYPVLKLGAGAYYATDLGAAKLVDLVLRNRTMAFGDIFKLGNGYSAAALTASAHPAVAGAQVWTQKTYNQWLGTDYWYAFAGNPTATPSSSGGTVALNPAQLVSFSQGTFSGYQFGSTGLPTAVKSYTLPRASAASAGRRGLLVNQSGTWLYIVNGVWAGYWIRESAQVHLSTTTFAAAMATAPLTYSPPVALSFMQGTHTAYTFDAYGRMLGQKTYTLARSSGASTSARRAIAGQSGSWFYVVNGVWAGYWVRESDVVKLAR